MKNLKLIITNLIFVLTLVILTSGIVFANGNCDVNISINRDSAGNPQSYELQIIKDGNKLDLLELGGSQIMLTNQSDTSKAVSFGIYENAATSVDQIGPPWDDNFLEARDMIDFDYDIDTKTIIITPENYDASLGYIIESVKITYSAPDPSNPGDFIDYVFEKPIEIPVEENAEFKVVPYFTGNTIKYYLKVENSTFWRLGGVSVYFNSELRQTFENAGDIQQLTTGNYYPNQTLTLKNSRTGQVFSNITIPNIRKIVAQQADDGSQEAKIVFKKYDRDGNESIMTLSDFRELGWKDADFKDLGTGKIYTLNFSTGTFTDGNGSISATGTITLPKKGGYEVWIHNTGNGDNVFNTKVYPIDLSLFTGELDREHEFYIIKYPITLGELESANAGKKFKVALYTMEDELIDEVDSTGWDIVWHVGTDSVHEFKDGNALDLYNYNSIKIRFHCTETGLDKTIVVEVPKLDTISDLYAEIVEPGKVTLYSHSTGETITVSELYRILGYGDENTNNSDYRLAHNSGGLHVLDRLEARINRVHDEIIEFSDFTNVEDSIRYAEEELNSYSDYELMAYMNEIKILYDYYKVVKSNGDVPLFVQLDDANGNSINIFIETPVAGVNINDGLPGIHPYFEGITGIALSAYDDMALILEAALARVATLVDNGVLNIAADEDYKLFYVPNNGIYYTYQESTTGISNSTPFICIPRMVADERQLAYAGRHIGQTQDNKQLGEYVYYNSGSVSFGIESTQANCFPLIGGAIYKVMNWSNEDVTVHFQRLDINGDGSDYDLVEILDQTSDNLYLTLQSDEYGYEAVKLGYILADSAGFFESLGSMLARFVRSLANGLNYLVQMSLRAVGGDNITSTVDIDSIIFNKYPDTSIAFFKTNKGGESPSKMIEMFRDAVNTWYNIFRGIAIAGYLVILLYIGVRILLNVGSNKQAQYKELLISWVVGIILLTFFPYVIRYAIEINNIFVGMVEESKSGVLRIADASSTIDMSDFSLPTVADSENFGAISQQMDQNPFADSDNSYMATMARKAHKTGNLVDAVVYLVMVWQFIMIVILYYKRVFTIAFLIAIFPFVTLSYAIDKIGDGQAQAFNTWTKEIVINIFIQSIHAVVYVFVIGATYVDGQYSGDWLLSIIGISFLFKGEEILKKIIGQSSGTTVKSLAKTAQRAVTTIAATQMVVSSVSNNVIGAGSHLGRSIKMYRQWRTEKKVAKNMGFFNPPRPSIPSGNALRTFDPTLSGNTDYVQLANDIQTVNNENLADPEAYARALDNVLANRNNMDANVQALMQGLNLSDEQLNALGDMQRSAVETLVDGDKSDDEKYRTLKESIDAEIEAKIRLIIPGDDNDPDVQRRRAYMKRAMYYRLRDGDRKEKHKARSTDQPEVMTELTQAKNRRKQFFNPALVARNGIGNPFSDGPRPTPLSARAVAKRDNILTTHFGVARPAEATKEQRLMAESIVILKDFSDLNHATGGTAHKYTPKQVMRAARYVARHQDDSKEFKRAVKTTLHIDGEEAKAIVTEEIGRRYTNITGTDFKSFRKDIKSGAKVTPPATGTVVEKKKAVEDTKKAWRIAMREVKKDDKKAGTRHCYEESIEGEVSVKDALRKERDSHYSDRALAAQIVTQRQLRNDEEVTMIEDFAREQLDDLPEITYEPTYDGLTQKEHQKLAKDSRAKFVEELTRAGVTTSTALIGGAIGAGLNIGLSNEESAVSEALKGAAAGMGGGDLVAEQVMGRNETTKKLKILNPYTGEIEEFEVKKSGITKDTTWAALLSIEENEVIRYDDDRLKHFNYNLDMQYLKHKQDKEKRAVYQRRTNMYDEALRNSRRNP